MATDSAPSAQGLAGGNQPAAGAASHGTARAMRMVLHLLAVLAFAQAIFAGLFLDNAGDVWRGLHSVNGLVLLPILSLAYLVMAVMAWRSGRGPRWLVTTSAALLVAVFLENAMGTIDQVAVHVPLGVAIIVLLGVLLTRTRDLTA